MAIERLLERQASLLLIADGGEDGTVTLNSVECFKVKQTVVLSSATQPDLVLQVKRVISTTKLLVGPKKDKAKPGSPKNNLNSRTDISAYTTADGAAIRSSEQNKVRLDPRDIIQAVYEQEPTIALRTHAVDKVGNSHKDTRTGNDTSGDSLPASTSYGQVKNFPIEPVLTDDLYSAHKLDRYGGQWSSLHDSQTGLPQLISPSGALSTADLSKLTGCSFTSGLALLPHIWTTSIANGGTLTAINGELVLATNTTANGSAKIESNRRARFIIASHNVANMGILTPNPDNTDVIRRWGAYDPSVAQNGTYFENNSGSISIVILKNGVINKTIVEASFNGGNTFINDAIGHRYEIIYSEGTIYYLQDRKLIHREVTPTETNFGTIHLKVGQEILNINGNIVNNTMLTGGMIISRLGSFDAVPYPFFINTATTTIVQNTPGRLHRIVIGNKGTGASTLTLYNNVVASGEILTVIDTSDAVGDLNTQYVEFDIGLTAVTSGGQISITLILD